jgi:hypothetical protein
MVKQRLPLVVLAAFLPVSAVAAEDRCRVDLLPGHAHTAGERTPSPVDIVRLRDFGGPEAGSQGEPPFSLSPDGRFAALALRRADPGRDSYCVGVAVIPLDGRSAPRLVDVGGDFILNLSDIRSIPDVPVGNAEAVTPKWSPDGRWLAYLRRDGGRTRVWRARSDGSAAEAVTTLEEDARAVRWSGDGRSLIVKTRPGAAAGEAAIADEERGGFLYDRRFWTLSRSRPRPPLPIEEVELQVDPESGGILQTIPPAPKPAAGVGEEVLLSARSPAGARAWTSAESRAVILGPESLKVEIGGKTVACRLRFCSDAVGPLWWKNDEELFLFQNGTADNGGTTSLLRWRPARDRQPRLVLSTQDALIGCQLVRDAILCARETSLRPRHLVRIDPANGRMLTLFDPNPEFSALKKGEVRRLRWRDADGVTAYGDLVLPVAHRPGMRHPLVVVQYQSRGFLRGGTGDEYPIHAFAARGFAVLSVQRPKFFAAGKARDFDELMRMHTKDFAERRRVLKSLETGVGRTVAGGWADPARIGITGLSDGAATVQFALVNSSLFRAAALSSCCDEPSTSMFAAGRDYANLLIASGFPEPGVPDPGFWGRYSLAANAPRLRTPILLQLTEDEFRFGLETFVTLDRHRVPIEMYVFADGYHLKWRPAHRLAVYERAIDWFDFWLNGKTDEVPLKKAQYGRWRELARRQPH